MGRQLLTSPIVEGPATGPQVIVSDFIEELDPELGKESWFSWRVWLQGNAEYNVVEEVTVCIKIENHQLFTIKGIEPTNLDIPMGQVASQISLGVPQAGVSFSISRPLAKKVIAAHLSSGNEIEWKFLDVTLDLRHSQPLGGAFGIEFFEGSEVEEYPVHIYVRPSFCKGKKGRETCHEPVFNKAVATIEPFDPLLGRGIGESLREIKYTFKLDEGLLFKSDIIENVSLRRETLTRLFEAFASGLTEDCSEVLREAGRQIGLGFTRQIQKVTSRELELERWSLYDASAGMGKLSFQLQDGMPRQVKLKNSFEAHGRESKVPICCFFEGYIEAVLSTIVGQDLSVKEVQCISQGYPVCSFKVE